VLCYTDYRFYQRILENSWIFTEKNREIWNAKHFQNSIVYYLFFYLLVFLTSFFLFYLPIVIKKFLKFLYFLLYRSEILSMNSAKLWFFLCEKIWYIWNKKFHQNSEIYYFFLIFLSFLTSFFFYFTYPNLWKDYWSFCGVLLEGLEILSTNFGNFLKVF